MQDAAEKEVEEMRRVLEDFRALKGLACQWSLGRVVILGKSQPAKNRNLSWLIQISVGQKKKDQVLV